MEEYVKPKTVRMSYKTWEELEDNRPAGVYTIVIRGKGMRPMYTWSEDGYGSYYYDSWAELTENH
jgi:hypothetical protein